jgi:outer membrane lipase/esterase
MLRKMLHSAVILLLLLSCTLANAALPGFSNIIFFGDSLTDIGNFVANPPVPCVEVNAPVTSLTGLNAGNTWANINSQGFFATASKFGGNDFAVVGSETTNVLYQQIGLPTAPVPGSYLYRLAATNTRADPNALYVIWVGANDILDRIFNPNPALRIDPGIVVAQGMNNILRMLVNLYSVGARHFLIIGVPNIALAPIASSTDTSLSLLLVGSLHQQQAAVSAASIAWNQALFSPVNVPSQGAPLIFFKLSHPDTEVLVWDPSFLLQTVVANPALYGFPPTINGFPNNQEIACRPPNFPQQDPNNFIFFNFLHPTSKAHTIIAVGARMLAQEFG